MKFGPKPKAERNAEIVRLREKLKFSYSDIARELDMTVQRVHFIYKRETKETNDHPQR